MIAITGGGTGGHLKIAKVVMKELNKKGVRPIYIGSTTGQDKEWFFNEDGFSEKYFLSSSGVVNKKGLNKILSLKHILSLSFEVKDIFKKHNIKKVFSVGGFSAAPASIAAVLFKKELYIHEQNAYIGSLNRLLKPFSKRFFNTFLYNDPYPIDDEFFKRARVRENIKRVIFLGGSQGAVAINDLAMKLAFDLKKEGIEIIHQTGKRDYKRVKDFYKNSNLDVDVFDFSSTLYEKVSQSDLAISRAGASTLFELSANLIPTIFIPYPYAANNHQYFNAKFLVDRDAGFLIEQSKLDLVNFVDFIKRVDVKKISLNLKSLNLSNSDDIIKALL